MRILLLLCFFPLGILVAGCSAESYDQYIEKRAAYSEEQDRRYDEWFNAVMD